MFRLKNTNMYWEKNEDAFIAYLDNLTLLNGDATNYFKCLNKQFEEALLYFKDSNGFMVHKNLVVKDKIDNLNSFEELSSELKHKISTFISIQKTSLHCFLSKLDFSENHFPRTVLKWNGFKTDFVELATALLEGGFITSENGSISKKEFMEQFSNIFNIDIPFYKNLLSKAMLRENSATFTHKLNFSLTDYYKRLIDKLKSCTTTKYNSKSLKITFQILFCKAKNLIFLSLRNLERKKWVYFIGLHLTANPPIILLHQYSLLNCMQWKSLPSKAQLSQSCFQILKTSPLNYVLKIKNQRLKNWIKNQKKN